MFGFIELQSILAGIGWENMFVLDTEQVTYAEKVIRPLLVFILLVVLFRFLGKREIAQLNPLDFVVLLLVSDTVQNAIIGSDTSVSGGVIGVIALLTFHKLLARVKFNFRWIERLLEGSPHTLISDGKIDEDAIRQELLTKNDLNVIAQKEGYEDSDDIEKCILNPNGIIYVEGYEGARTEEKFREEILAKIDALAEQLKKLGEKTT